MSKAVIIGTGGHAQVIWATWQATQNSPGGSPVEVVGWLEHAGYQGGDYLLGLPVFLETEAGLLALSQRDIHSFYFGMGMVRAISKRWDVFQRIQSYGLTSETLIHPTAVVDSSATVESGCFIGARSVIQPFARLGAATIVNTGSIIEHHTCIGDNVHLAPGSIACGDTRVGSHSMIGAGAILKQQVSVGSYVTVGAGSVVLQSIGDGITIVGNPSRPLSQSVQLFQESVFP